MEQISEIFKFVVDHLEGVAGSLSVIIALQVFNQSNKDKKLEIYMNLYQQWDTLWVKVTAYPLLNNELFQKEYKDLDKKEEDLRFAIFQIITLFSRVFYYYQKTSQKITKSDWHKEAQYMMQRRLFVSAYLKYSSRYTKEFNDYMESLISEHYKAPEVITPETHKKKSAKVITLPDSMKKHLIDEDTTSTTIQKKNK